MRRLGISLFGAVQILQDGDPDTGSAHDKVRALLAYLLVESDRPHQREVLAELFWPDQPDGRGRHSLRQALVTLRNMVDDQNRQPSLLLATRDTIQIPAAAVDDFDIRRFTGHLQAISSCPCTRSVPCSDCVLHLEEAARCYHADFLADLTVDASPEFEEWVSATRVRLKTQALGAMDQLCAVHLQAGRYPDACDNARRQLAVDPLRERAHRHLMLALYFSGDRQAALAQFDHCKTMLRNEIGVDPDPETVAVCESIRDGTAAADSGRDPTVSLPSPATPFFGRATELAEIASMLARRDCRLITLTGPGGVGKTRLAIEAASRTISAFPDGVFFVPLAGLSSYEGLVTAVSDVVLPAFSEYPEAEDSLLAYLRDKQMLLLLDNFEQLVQASPLISRLLAEAAQIRIIVTSRQRLNLLDQWVVDLAGLQQTDAGNIDMVLQTDSAQLFVESARRATTRVSLKREDVIAIGRICRLVDGIPLALELAAAWAPVLSFSEIANEIEQSLDFLASSFRDVADRHRSMRAVFDHSWSLLSRDEQEVFARLSVLRGGFVRPAVEQIADATLAVLSDLVRKSLVYRRDDSRYDVHELLRQYGEAKLWGMGQVRHDVAANHAEYFCGFLEQREASLRGRNQESAMREVSDDLENVRVAWRWAAEHHRADLLLQAAHGFWIFLEITSRYYDTEALFGLAVDRMQEAGPYESPHPLRDQALAAMLVRYGSVFERLGDYQRGELLADEGCELARRLNAIGTLGLGLNFKGMFALERLDHLTAADLFRESIECFQVVGDGWGEAYSTNDLSMAILRSGDVDEAERVNRLATMAFAAIDDKRGLAFALTNRGVIVALTGRYPEAFQYLQQAEDIRKAMGHTWGVSMTLLQKGAIARKQGDDVASMQYLLQALQAANDVQAPPAILSVLSEIAANLASAGSREPAIQLLTAILHHPASDSTVGSRAGDILVELGVDVVAIEDGPVLSDRADIERFARDLLQQAVASSPGPTRLQASDLAHNSS
jgi:DNA-binding SARP family transcriptional activator/predicted ATPase